MEAWSQNKRVLLKGTGNFVIMEPYKKRKTWNIVYYEEGYYMAGEYSTEAKARKALEMYDSYCHELYNGTFHFPQDAEL